MITVYNFASGARGLRIAWQCEEMGLAYRSRVLTYPTPADYQASLGALMNPQIATRFAAPDDQKINWTAGFCEAQVTSYLAYAETQLGENDYFAGDRLTLADIAIATTLGMWVGALGKPVPPRLAAHRERMMQRPAYQRAKAAFAT